MNYTLIGCGRTSEVFKYDESHVLKLYYDFMSKEAIENEFAVSEFVYGHTINTPKPLQIITENGRTGIVYEEIRGQSFLAVLGKNPLRMKYIARQMAELHTTIHSVTYQNPHTNQKLRMISVITQSPDLDQHTKDRIIAYIHTLPDGTALCHGDFHPDNILVANQKLWIIDWMTGMQGDAAGDVARTKMLIETSELPGEIPYILKKLMQSMQKKLADAYVKEYLKVSSWVTMDEIKKWMLPNYAARLVENLSVNEKKLVLKRITNELERLDASPVVAI